MKEIELTTLRVRKPVEFLDTGSVAELAQSLVRYNGVLNPLMISPGFEIIDGWHRLMAAHQLGHKSVPCHFFTSEKDAWAWACIHSPPRRMADLETAYTFTRAVDHLAFEELDRICSEVRVRRYISLFEKSGLQIRNWSLS